MLKAWRLGRPFTVADLAEPCKPMMVVEALSAMMTDEFIEQVSLGGCRWCYRLTPDGIAEAEKIARLEAVAA